MKNAILWKLSMGVSAVLLAACGSSGGGSGVVVSHHASGSSSLGKTTANSSSSTNSQSAGNAQSTTPVNNPSEWGGTVSAFKVGTGTNVFTEYGKAGSLSGSSLDKLVINGKEITLLDKSEDKWVKVHNSNLTSIIHGGYDYTRFGLYETKEGKTDYMDIIAHGKLTPAADVPATGSAKYTGHALYADENVEWAEGTSTFNVDFGAKTIAGNVNIPQASKTIGLEGKIDGNSFAGVHGGNTMQGHFFGPKAEELSGTFHKGTAANPEYVGAFGGKK